MADSEMKPELQLYEDADLTKPVSTLSFGRVPVGKSYEKKLYLANHNPRWPIVNIQCNESKDPNVKINYPEFIRPNSKEEVTIQWAPSLSRREALDTPHLFTGDLYIG